MLKKNRLEQITNIIYTSGSVEINQLCRVFNVTKMTIRRDLDELASKGLIVKTHGGATVSEEKLLVEKPFEARFKQHYKQKEAIANLALAMINEGQKVYIDSGTTCFILSRLIDNTQRLIIATNALNIANELNARTNISVILVGGELRKNTLACSGYFTEDMIKQIKVDLAFVGVGGIGNNGQLYSGSVIEIGIKKAILESAKQTVILSDSSKIGRDEFVSFGNLKNINYLITDSNAPDSILNEYKKTGAAIRVAPVR